MIYNWIVKRPEPAAAIYEAGCTTPEQAAVIAARLGEGGFRFSGERKGCFYEKKNSVCHSVLTSAGL